MSDIPRLAVVSSLDDDVRLCQELAARLDADFALWNDENISQSIRPDLLENLIVFVDADRLAQGASGTDQPSVLSQLVMQGIKTPYIVALSSKPINSWPNVVTALSDAGFPILHNVVRSNDVSQLKILPAVLRSLLSESQYTLKSFYLAPKAYKKLQIAKSSQRPAIVEAITNLFTQLNCEARVSVKGAQAVDEILLNSIFAAPRTAAGRLLRLKTDRAASFMLSLHESVSVELGWNDDFIAVSVVDNFGSLEIDYALSLVYRNFRAKDYDPHQRCGPSAGLGLYGIVESGLSLSVLVTPRQSTRVTVFIPRAANMRDFKKSFRFFSFIRTTQSDADDEGEIVEDMDKPRI